MMQAKNQQSSKPVRERRIDWIKLEVALATSGAALGPWLDNFHGAFGVLTYRNPIEFAFGQANTILRTAAFVPPLFGLAGIIIGSLYIILDQFFSTDVASLMPPTSRILLGIAYFSFQYYLSALLCVFNTPLVVIHTSLAATAFLCWYLFDKTTTGVAVAFMTAVGGTSIEVFLINQLHLYDYAAADLFGVDSWIPWVYMCGAVAVGNLSRGYAAALKKDDGL